MLFQRIVVGMYLQEIVKNVMKYFNSVELCG